MFKPAKPKKIIKVCVVEWFNSNGLILPLIKRIVKTVGQYYTTGNKPTFDEVINKLRIKTCNSGSYIYYQDRTTDIFYDEKMKEYEKNLEKYKVYTKAEKKRKAEQEIKYAENLLIKHGRMK